MLDCPIDLQHAYSVSVLALFLPVSLHVTIQAVRAHDVQSTPMLSVVLAWSCSLLMCLCCTIQGWRTPLVLEECSYKTHQLQFWTNIIALCCWWVTTILSTARKQWRYKNFVVMAAAFLPVAAISAAMQVRYLQHAPGTHFAAAVTGVASAVLMSVACFLALVGWVAGFGGASSDSAADSLSDTAEEPLLNPGKPEKDQSLTAKDAWRYLKKAIAYVKPETTRLLACIIACFMLVMLECAVNLVVPILYKNVVNVLSQHSWQLFIADTWSAEERMAKLTGSPNDELLKGVGSGLQAESMFGPAFWAIFNPWIAVYLAAYFLQGGSSGASVGLLSNMRGLLWIPITQHAFRRVSLEVFAHLLHLDHSFHLKRKTGKVMRILDRGTGSMQTLVQVVLFNVLPQLINISLACSYLAIYLQVWVAVIVFITVASYIPITIIVTEWRGKIRIKLNKLDNDKETRATDMLLNYETVKIFANEPYEVERFDTVILKYQGMELLQMACLNVLNILQSLIIFAGLASGMAVCVAGVAAGTLKVGDTVLFLTMMNQLYAPLNIFSSYYRQSQKALIDMSSLFDMLDTPSKVQDVPDATQLTITQANIKFSGVSFSYDPRDTALQHAVLRDVSFEAQGGKTIALVGTTGSGKSSVLRMLLRFYDPMEGAVYIDGQDISTVSLSSLRRQIAVVPQDAVLFNDTIGYNIGYGDTNATMESIEWAAKIARIHNTIETRFAKGYRTKVGERGLRMSGGEKQRVAFARTVLRQARILLLDEATSALDSVTERAIQEAVSEMRSRCTTLIVAHRLSTVSDADEIVVMEHGCVCERGTHSQLIEQEGLYWQMWMRQQHGFDPSADSSSLPNSSDNVSPADSVLGMESTDAPSTLSISSATAAVPYTGHNYSLTGRSTTVKPEVRTTSDGKAECVTDQNITQPFAGTSPGDAQVDSARWSGVPLWRAGSNGPKEQVIRKSRSLVEYRMRQNRIREDSCASIASIVLEEDESGLLSEGAAGSASIHEHTPDDDETGEPDDDEVGEPDDGEVGEPDEDEVGEPDDGEVGEPDDGEVGEPDDGEVGGEVAD